MDKLNYKLEVFEGPMDLLLHLITKHKLDIYDIPILELVEQYTSYVREMQEENMEVASEFLAILRMHTAKKGKCHNWFTS